MLDSEEDTCSLVSPVGTGAWFPLVYPSSTSFQRTAQFDWFDTFLGEDRAAYYFGKWPATLGFKQFLWKSAY